MEGRFINISQPVPTIERINGRAIERLRTDGGEAIVRESGSKVDCPFVRPFKQNRVLVSIGQNKNNRPV